MNGTKEPDSGLYHCREMNPEHDDLLNKELPHEESSNQRSWLHRTVSYIANTSRQIIGGVAEVTKAIAGYTMSVVVAPFKFIYSCVFQANDNSSKRAKPDEILKFYDNPEYKIPGQTLTFNDIKALPEKDKTGNGKDLEETHAYIQLLFPNFKASSFNETAPILTERIAEALMQDGERNKRIKTAIKKILDFWGLHVDFDKKEVSLNPDKTTSHIKWLTEEDHNKLRVCRVLHFLKAIGEHELAESMLQIMNGQKEAETGEINKLWQKAVNEPQKASW